MYLRLCLPSALAPWTRTLPARSRRQQASVGTCRPPRRLRRVLAWGAARHLRKGRPRTDLGGGLAGPLAACYAPSGGGALGWHCDPHAPGLACEWCRRFWVCCGRHATAPSPMCPVVGCPVVGTCLRVHSVLRARGAVPRPQWVSGLRQASATLGPEVRCRMPRRFRASARRHSGEWW